MTVLNRTYSKKSMSIHLMTIANSRIVSFLFIGILSSLLDIGIMYYCITYFGIWYLFASAFSYICGIVFSYTANRCITFHDTSKKYLTQFATFVTIAISCLIVNLGIMWLVVTYLSLAPVPAKIIATCCAFIWSYYGQSRITFKTIV